MSSRPVGVWGACLPWLAALLLHLALPHPLARRLVLLRLVRLQPSCACLQPVCRLQTSLRRQAGSFVCLDQACLACRSDLLAPDLLSLLCFWSQVAAATHALEIIKPLNWSNSRLRSRRLELRTLWPSERPFPLVLARYASLRLEDRRADLVGCPLSRCSTLSALLDFFFDLLTQLGVRGLSFRAWHFFRSKDSKRK